MENMVPKGAPERTQPPGSRSVIETAKDRVPTIDLAERLCGPGQLRRVGDKWVARCPLPEHDDRSPSFTVFPQTGSFFCFGCQAGGDVVDLACAAWHYPKADAAMAAGELLTMFGHEIPSKPATWFRKQARQAPVRDAIDAARFRRVQRRLFRWFYAPVVAGFEDEAEHAEETRQAWEECELLARLLIDGRRS